MLTPEHKKCIKIVAAGLKQQLPEKQIIQNLLLFGLSLEGAQKAFELIRHGIKSGVNAAVTNGLSAKDYVPGSDELYDAAFKIGHWYFRRHMWATWLRWALTAVVALAVIFWVTKFLF